MLVLQFIALALLHVLDTIWPVCIVVWSSLEILKKEQRKGKVLLRFWSGFLRSFLLLV